ncbi:MAG TPA: hypothetical protein VN228_15595 [Pyrinomonadaceae bacterium]|nr:hypothetical protein [Pyrinomonadaceae bacterium]
MKRPRLTPAALCGIILALNIQAPAQQTSRPGGAAATQAATASPPTPAQTAEAEKNPPVRWSELLGHDNRIKLYGFLRLDFDSQHPNNTQIPFFITTPDARAGGTANGDYSIHPRLTRFGDRRPQPQVAYAQRVGEGFLPGVNNRVNIFLQYNF